jgi:HEAT repeat protein
MWKWLSACSLPLPRPYTSSYLRGPEPETRRQAAVLLGEIVEPWVAAELVESLGDAHSAVREAARESLAP